MQQFSLPITSRSRRQVVVHTNDANRCGENFCAVGIIAGDRHVYSFICLHVRAIVERHDVESGDRSGFARRGYRQTLGPGKSAA